MSSKLHLTFATGDYESIRALKEGSVRPDGIELTVLTDMTSDTRHWRLLRNREFARLCGAFYSTTILLVHSAAPNATASSFVRAQTASFPVLWCAASQLVQFHHHVSTLAS